MEERKSRRDRSAHSGNAESQPEDKARDEELETAAAKLDEICREGDRLAESQRDLPISGFNASSGDGGGTYADVQDLNEAWDDFYAGYQNLIKRYVPKCELRDMIWEMGKLYLKEGNTSHADSRQATPTQRQTLKEEVVDWVMEYRGSNPSNLFNSLYVLNKEAGHRPDRVL